MAEEQVFPDDYLKLDKSNMLGVIREMPRQVERGYELGDQVDFEKQEFDHVVWGGMGGSAIAGDLLKVYLNTLGIPFTVVRDYKVPEFVNEKTLFIGSSYSGNTEETLSMFKDAARKNAFLFAITTGGRLEELCKTHRKEFVRLPTGMQPRNTVALMFFAILRVLEKFGVVEDQSSLVENTSKKLASHNPEETCIKIAERLHGRVPLVYASETFYPVAFRWKTEINENAKALAFSQSFPEANHNDLQGYENLEAPFYALFLKTDEDHRRVLKRMELTKQVMQQKGIPVMEIGIKGDWLSKIFSAVYMGDFVSFYLALKYRQDPTSVGVIESFKKSLGPYAA